MKILFFILGAITAIIAGCIALYWWLKDTKPMGY